MCSFSQDFGSGVLTDSSIDTASGQSFWFNYDWSEFDASFDGYPGHVERPTNPPSA